MEHLDKLHSCIILKARTNICFGFTHFETLGHPNTLINQTHRFNLTHPLVRRSLDVQMKLDKTLKLVSRVNTVLPLFLSMMLTKWRKIVHIISSKSLGFLQV